jgi:hypothetical protein
MLTLHGWDGGDVCLERIHPRCLESPAVVAGEQLSFSIQLVTQFGYLSYLLFDFPRGVVTDNASQPLVDFFGAVLTNVLLMSPIYRRDRFLDPNKISLASAAISVSAAIT